MMVWKLKLLYSKFDSELMHLIFLIPLKYSIYILYRIKNFIFSKWPRRIELAIKELTNLYDAKYNRQTSNRKDL